MRLPEQITDFFRDRELLARSVGVGRFLLRGLVSLVGLLVALALLFVAFIYVKSSTIGDETDAAHLAAKQAYLAQVANLPVSPDRPNLVFILFDDLGYGDLGIYGSQAIKTPAIDALAKQGAVFTNFHAPAPVCAPSRAGFLTGRYAAHTSMVGIPFPSGTFTDKVKRATGLPAQLPPDEITLADILHAAHYQTMMIGKWHLGDVAPSLPTDFGFETFFGALFSNDQEPFKLYEGVAGAPLKPLDYPVDQTKLTARYTQHAVDFIHHAGASDKPFFLYLAHSFPHRPLHADPAHAGKSDAGLYGDVVGDLDRSVAAVVDALRASGKLDNTMIVISSDNGPWWEGDASNARGRKGSSFEGAQLVPGIFYDAKRIAAGKTVTGLAAGMDLVPTMLEAAGIPLPMDRVIDGVSLWPSLRGEADAKVTARPFLYFQDRRVTGLRENQYKLLGPVPVLSDVYALSSTLLYTPTGGPWLFNLALDPRESYDISTSAPELAKKMADDLTAARKDFADNPRGWLPLK